MIDVKFDEGFKSDLRFEFINQESCKNLLNNEGKFRKIEEKRLPIFSNPQYLSVKFPIQNYM